MAAIRRGTSAIAIAALLAACSGNGAATNPPATGGGGGATAGASLCTEPAAGTAADVDATVAGNAWGPVSAAVGDVITWTNSDAAPHKVALDDGSCTMTNNITGDAPQSLVFNEAGSYPFHCTVHPSMKGTIAIS
jgi:plastocyanin